MNIGGANISKKVLVSMVILVLGLVVGVYLIQNMQVFKSKASQDTSRAFQITQQDENGQERRIDCIGNECTVHSLNLKVKVDVNQLNP